MKINALILLFCASLFFFYGCKKNKTDSDPTNSTIASDEVGINGMVKIANGTALAGVTVDVEGTKVITKDDGSFEYKGLVKDLDKVKLTISKTGYLSYTKILTLEKNATIDGLVLYLLQEATAGSFDAVNGGVIMNGNREFIFAANSFTTDDDVAYKGKVTIKIPPRFYNGSANQQPGDVRGINKANENVIVDAIGVLHIAAYGENGSKLKLIKPMAYTFSSGYGRFIDPTNKVKIWSYNNVNDTWMEAGDATFEGSNIKGTISSLSTFQWAIPYPVAFLRVSIKEKELAITSGYEFSYGLDVLDNMGSSAVKVNSNGVALIYLPAQANIYPLLRNSCGDRMAAASIPAIPLGKKEEREIDFDFSPFVTSLEGRIEDCSYTGINGRAELTFEGKTWVCQLNNGAFKFNLLSCQMGYPNAKLVIYDSKNAIIHQNNSCPIMMDKKNQHYTISLCDKPQSGKITVNVEGKTYVFQSPKDVLRFSNSADQYGRPLTYIEATSAERNESFAMYYYGEQGGDNSLLSCGFGFPGKVYTMTSFFPLGNAQVTKYKSGNTLIEGTLTTQTHINFSINGNNKAADLSASFSIGN